MFRSVVFCSVVNAFCTINRVCSEIEHDFMSKSSSNINRNIRPRAVIESYQLLINKYVNIISFQFQLTAIIIWPCVSSPVAT